jgi:hypothetical protein
MNGTLALLTVSGVATGLGIGLVAWGWRSGNLAVTLLGVGLLFQGLASLGFYVVWAPHGP